MKKSFGFGKKHLYLGLAFLVVVVLLWFFIFSGMREGFYGYVDDGASVFNENPTQTTGTKCAYKKPNDTTSGCTSITSNVSCVNNSNCKWV